MAPYPLFYWYDADQDGHWLMLVDREETGSGPCGTIRLEAGGRLAHTFSKTW
ncbi:MAG: hypothetical protein MRJ92_01950 [Nitrospira sp.]|nr:hypothetical protein [Nitrospira sp.]